jgi:hypothetical protein
MLEKFFMAILLKPVQYMQKIVKKIFFSDNLGIANYKNGIIFALK